MQVKTVDESRTRVTMREPALDRRRPLLSRFACDRQRLPSERVKAVFLDKDGTLIEDVPYNVDPAKIRLSHGAIEGLQVLHAAGYKLFVITNQSGVARGFFSESALLGVENYLTDALAEGGVPLAGFYYCPHHPDGVIPEYSVPCLCRKPQPGLIQQAACDHNINLSQSWFIGDILNDIEAGRSAGCRTVLINNGNETHWHLSYHCLPHHIVEDLSEAARVIMAVDGPVSVENPQRSLTSFS